MRYFIVTEQQLSNYILLNTPGVISSNHNQTLFIVNKIEGFENFEAEIDQPTRDSYLLTGVWE